MSELQGAQQEAADPPPPPPYIIFVVVFLFFITGLCGFLVCHLLKLKGYRCIMEDDEDDDEELEEEQDDEDEESQDTVEKILKCIIENEANMEAFNEMVGKGNLCVRHDPRLRKESMAGLPAHLHTVHSGTDFHDTCHLCAQIRNKRARRPSRTPRFRKPGEQTVFSVGRFRVTHTDKKSTDGGGRMSDVLVGSGDNLDQSQDSEERRDGGYNLRSLFKDSRPPSESTSNTGKRRRSLTIFGLRRGSDPIGVKVVSTGRESVRFIPQPVVFEEPQSENIENRSKERRQSLEIAASRIKKTSPSITGKTLAENSVDLQSSTQGVQLQTKDLLASSTPPPNSLPISLGSSVGRVTEEQTNLSPGPLQTSTPLSPIPAEKVIQFIPQVLQGSQTPPDPCTSPVIEYGSFASPSLISLGSSPHLTLRTPASPAAPSAKFQLKSQPIESNQSAISLQTPSSVTPQDDALVLEMPSKEPGFISAKSPIKWEGSMTQTSTKDELKNLKSFEEDKILSELSTSSAMPNSKLITQVSDQSMNSPQTSSSVSLQDEALALEMTSKEHSPISSLSQTKVEGSTSQVSMEGKPILKNLVNEEENKNKFLLSSPREDRISSVTVIKNSPDSNREFSVAKMVEEQSVTLITDVQEAIDNQGEKVIWTLRNEKEKVVEMEQSTECRVTEEGESGIEGKATDEASLQ